MPLKSQSGLALLYVTSLLARWLPSPSTGRWMGAKGLARLRPPRQGGWRAPAPRTPRTGGGLQPGGPAAENTSFHWHKTRDTEEAQLKQKHGGGWREGRTGSQQRKPSVCQQFTWTGLLGLWHFVSQCNFTLVCACVSPLYKQKATTRRKLINFKI